MSGEKATDHESETSLDASGDSDIGTANTMRERADESRIKLGVLLSANRLLVTGLLALVVFVCLLAVGSYYYPAFQSSIRTADPIQTIFSAMLGGIITGVTLVLTITQIVISQENGPLGDQHERMSDTMNVRDYTEELIGAPSPADPSAFLREIVDASQDRAEALRESLSGNANDDLLGEVDEFTDSLTGNAEEVREGLDGAAFGTFDVLFAALNYNYGWKVFQVERIANEYEEDLSEDDIERFDELKTSLSLFGPAREHVKTLYFQWALIDLTQTIIYASVPAIIVAAAMMSFVRGESFTGVVLGLPNVIWVVAGALTVTLVPFLLLLTYIARIATVAKRTLAIGPFILRNSQR